MRGSTSSGHRLSSAFASVSPAASVVSGAELEASIEGKVGSMGAVSLSSSMLSLTSRFVSTSAVGDAGGGDVAGGASAEDMMEIEIEIIQCSTRSLDRVVDWSVEVFHHCHHTLLKHS